MPVGEWPDFVPSILSKVYA